MKKTAVIATMFSLMIAIFLCGCSSEEHSIGIKLYNAIDSNNVQAVKEVIKTPDLEKIDINDLPVSEGTNLNMKDSRALSLAMLDGCDNEILRMIIDAGADVTPRSDDSETYLHEAGTDTDLIKMLLDAGADINAENEEGETALFGVIDFADLEGIEDLPDILDFFVENGAKIDKKTIKACVKNPYMYSKSAYVLEKAKEQGADIPLSKPVQFAMEGNNKQLIGTMKNGKVTEKDRNAVLFNAAANCNVDVMKLLDKMGVDLKKKDEAGQTLLHIAARYNDDTKVLDYLLKKGLSLDAKTSDDSWKVTPLAYAAASGSLEKTKKMLDKAGGWKKKDAKKQDMFAYVCKYGVPGAINTMLSTGYVPDKEEIIMGITNSYSAEVIDDLLSAGIDLDFRRDDESPIDQTAVFSEEKTIELLKKGIEPTMDAAVSTVDSGYNKAAKMILKSAGDNMKMQMMSAAIMNGNYEIVKVCLKKGVNINKTFNIDEEENYKGTMMHVAALEWSEDILKYLIDNGGKKNIKDSDRNTPLDLAKKAGINQNIELLR